MSAAYSQVRNTISILIGIAINLILLTAPARLMGTPLTRISTDPVFVIFITLITLWIASESALSSRLSNTVRTPIKSRWIPYATGLSIYLLLSISTAEHLSTHPRAISSLQTSALAAIGAALMLAGILLRLRSVRQLGDLFKSHIALTPNHQLITTGLYSVVRHPSELGLLLLASGTVFLLASPIGLLLTLAILLPLTLLRISREDTLLHSAFAREFEHYKHTVPALSPRLQRRQTCANIDSCPPS